MKRLILFIVVVLTLFFYSTAFGDRVQITIESYANPALGVKSTIFETADPYDPNDPADQLAMAHEAMSFAWSSDGWDFESEGFYEGSSAGCNGTTWGLGVDGNTFLYDPNPTYYEDLLGGYPVSGNSQAMWAIHNTPSNQATGLVFHIDALCSQGNHNFCGGANNYGQIGQVMAGYYMQCAVANWGTFTVEPSPPPDVHGCIYLENTPLNDVEVSLEQRDEITQTTMTDSNGCYEFQTINREKDFTVNIEGEILSD